MFRLSRPLIPGLLAAVLLVGVSCTSDNTPVGPTSNAGVEEPSLLLGDLPLIGDVLQKLNLLTCSTQPYVAVTKVIGTAGGTIQVGTHRLTIPAGALSQPVAIKAEQVSGKVNSVRFSPAGLKFAKPATLAMSYANCSPILLGRKIVYTSELLRILELLPSVDNSTARTVTGPVRHFSRYAVAW